MKKALILIALMTVVTFSEVAFAANEDIETAKTEVTSSEKATSNATIGFTKQTSTSDVSLTKPTGRLPTTGETIGMGASFLGLLLIIIIFKQDLKDMILNKKKYKGE